MFEPVLTGFCNVKLPTRPVAEWPPSFFLFLAAGFFGRYLKLVDRKE
jgi:hypothetical protein